MDQRVHILIPIAKLGLPNCTPTSSIEECLLSSFKYMKINIYFYISFMNQFCLSFEHLAGGGRFINIINLLIFLYCNFLDSSLILTKGFKFLCTQGYQNFPLRFLY